MASCQIDFIKVSGRYGRLFDISLVCVFREVSSFLSIQFGLIVIRSFVLVLHDENININKIINSIWAEHHGDVYP